MWPGGGPPMWPAVQGSGTMTGNKDSRQQQCIEGVDTHHMLTLEMHEWSWSSLLTAVLVQLLLLVQISSIHTQLIQL